ncbi:hypothetical protein K435DRAFT_424007 [Dendrothele bispora CBS 962.96]|uniref:Uncharacterized protein n=1 Tax=Dendrothele bispora (strain CBS 962.96) TaxID=1314807 RepID=A0A4S8L5H5_DENBC|nr:hypothetical protein K435DRAFT_424007 [Dendrothele bispora CBS 962.96]
MFQYIPEPLECVALHLGPRRRKKTILPSPAHHNSFDTLTPALFLPTHWYHFTYSLFSQNSTRTRCPRQTSIPGHLESSLRTLFSPGSKYRRSKECHQSENITSEG